MSDLSNSGDAIVERIKSAEDEIAQAFVPQSPSYSLENLMNLWELAGNVRRRFLFQALAVHSTLEHRNMRAKTGAPFDLSRESLATLYQLAENAQNLELLKAAALELDKRRGCDV